MLCLIMCNAVCPVDMEEPLGMENGDIPDGSITASSFYGNSADHAPIKARLNTQGNFYSLVYNHYIIIRNIKELQSKLQKTRTKKLIRKDVKILTSWTNGQHIRDMNKCYHYFKPRQIEQYHYTCCYKYKLQSGAMFPQLPHI